MDNEQIFPREMGEAIKEMARLRYGYGRWGARLNLMEPSSHWHYTLPAVG
jgi:hypothetical protein